MTPQEMIHNFWDFHVQALAEEGMGDYPAWLEKLREYMPGEAEELERLSAVAAKEKVSALTTGDRTALDETVQRWVGRSLVLNDTLKQGRLI